MGAPDEGQSHSARQLGRKLVRGATENTLPAFLADNLDAILSGIGDWVHGLHCPYNDLQKRGTICPGGQIWPCG